MAVTLTATLPEISFAQKKSLTSIGFSAGYGTLMKADDSFLDGFLGTERTNYSGDYCFGAHYLRTISRRIDIGGEVNYSSFSSRDRWEYNKYQFLSFSGRMNYYYKRKENWRLYSGITLGVMFKTDREEKFPVSGSGPATVNTFKEAWPCGHLTAFGAEYGKNICPFAEIGIGTNGSVTGGIRAKF